MRVTQWSRKTLVTESGYSWGKKKITHTGGDVSADSPEELTNMLMREPTFTCQRHRGGQQTGGVIRETIMPKGRRDHSCRHQSWSFIKADIKKHTHLQLWQLCEHSDQRREKGPGSDTSIPLVNGTLQLCGSHAQILAKCLWTKWTLTVSQVYWNETAANQKWVTRGGGVWDRKANMKNIPHLNITIESVRSYLQ